MATSYVPARVPATAATLPRRSTQAVTPNWFASVMGTGIVANAAATLPISVPGLLDAARVVWVAAALWFAVLATATLRDLLRHPRGRRHHLDDPVLGHFLGAPAMAAMTVGLGALLLGEPLLGLRGAVAVDAVLWTAGTLLGLAAAVAVPVRLFARDDVATDEAGGPWLMSVVPPMVSAATGPALAAHIRDADTRATVLLLCGALFGAALVASLVTITLVWSRLAHHGVGAAAAVPTLWIVLGPLGQSATAAHALGVGAGDLAPGWRGAGVAASVVVAVPLVGFALLWMAIAAVLTVRTARTGLPFTLGWWSFTFPVGTCVTGISGLAATVGLPVVTASAVLLYGVLVAAWVTVAARTVHGVRSGVLRLRPIA